MRLLSGMVDWVFMGERVEFGLGGFDGTEMDSLVAVTILISFSGS